MNACVLPMYSMWVCASLRHLCVCQWEHFLQSRCTADLLHFVRVCAHVWQLTNKLHSLWGWLTGGLRENRENTHTHTHTHRRRFERYRYSLQRFVITVGNNSHMEIRKMGSWKKKCKANAGWDRQKQKYTQWHSLRHTHTHTSLAAQWVDSEAWCI